MKEINKALYVVLRDDSEAVVGLRTLLGNTTTAPYNVYYRNLPDNVDFKTTTNQSFITFFPVSLNYNHTFHDYDARGFVALYQFTAWSRSYTKTYDIVNRIKWRLDGSRSITSPLTDAVIHKILFENTGPETFDNEFKVNMLVSHVRVWGRDDYVS